MLTRHRLQTLLEKIRGLKIALVGDLFLDRYLELDRDAHELSIETGLEAYQVARVRNSPGALGTVMNNLAALGVGQMVPVTVIGDDGHGYDLMAELSRLPVEQRHVLRATDRLTPTYTKPLKPDSAGHWKELNRLDVRSREPLSSETSAELGKHLQQAFADCDGLIVLDQVVERDWGVVNGGVHDVLRELAGAEPGKLIFVDSRSHLQRFSHAVLKGNQHELQQAVKLESDELDELEAAVGLLSDKTGRNVYCTLGERGILVAENAERVVLVPAYPAAGPVDIVGAGDSATSGIVASLLAGAGPVEAAAVGNLVASITVQQLGTTGTASPEQLLARIG